MADQDEAAKADETIESGDELGDAGKKALDRERKARRDAEAKLRELEPLAAKAKELEDAQKSEAEKLQARISDLEQSKASNEVWARRLEAALSQAPEGASIDIVREAAKRITGDTVEELEADAAEFMRLLVDKTGSQPGQARPHTDLKPGVVRETTPPEDPLLRTLKAKLGVQ